MKTSQSSRNPRKILAGISVLAVAGVSVAVPALAATDYTYNPFDTNGDFTIVARGDATLGNGELEGSIAAFGSIAALKDNYPVRHQAQGTADYEVPVIDGDPVRILANTSTTSAGKYFSVTNGNAPSGSNEANAIAKLVDVSNITVGNYNGFTALIGTADNEKDIVLEKVPASTQQASKFTTVKSSVGAYFPEIESQISYANSCLAEIPTQDDAHEITTVSINGQSRLEVSNTKVNYLTYGPSVQTLAFNNVVFEGTTVDGQTYVPTAESPLVIRVPKGTTTLGPISFQGWDASLNAQQSYAKYIMWDLSELDADSDVTVTSITLGSIWAPNVNVTFNGDQTINGQWLTKDFDTIQNSGGELHHYYFEGKLKCSTPVSTESTSTTTSTTTTSTTTAPEPSTTTTSTTTAPEPSTTTTTTEPELVVTTTTGPAESTDPSDEESTTTSTTSTSGVTSDSDNDSDTDAGGLNTSDSDDADAESDSESLASTGAQIGVAVLAAGLLLAAGVSALVTSRRRTN